MTVVLVTGGLGYVGRELVRQLCEQDDIQLHVIDNLDCGEHRLEPMDQTKFTLHVTDIRDRQATADSIEKINPDLVYHLAAIHYIPLCERDPGNAVSVNIMGTVNLLDCLPKGTRFVFASTAAVYAPEDDAHTEGRSIEKPMDIYGWTKYHGEQYVRYYTDIGKMNGTIVRLFNVVGSGETNPHLAPAIIEQLSDGVTSVKLGNLFPHRDYIDVTDVALGFQKIAQAGSEQEDLLCCNLGTGRSHAVSEMVELIASAAGVALEIEQDSDRVRAVDRPMLKASTDRLKEKTGWTPSVPLSESMKRAWATRKADRLR
jgi:UDP-glucose 4-epimerase